MRISLGVVSLFLLLACSSPCLAQDVQTPDSIVEKMAIKLTRGIVNMATSPLEIPKQIFASTREYGGYGLLIGPLKGIGMTALRAAGGAAETAFFLVPQPGYYDPIMDPDYVWNNSDEKRVQLTQAREAGAGAPTEQPAQGEAGKTASPAKGE